MTLTESYLIASCLVFTSKSDQSPQLSFSVIGATLVIRNVDFIKAFVSVLSPAGQRWPRIYPELSKSACFTRGLETLLSALKYLAALDRLVWKSFGLSFQVTLTGT